MYPRELNLDENTEARLRSWLNFELVTHYAERSTWMTRLLQYQRDYWAEPTNKKATFPFSGASTIVIPLTAIGVEAVHARVMTTLFALNQLVSVKAISPQWEDAARPVEQFMNKELIYGMDFRKRIGNSILELEKFGTGIAKVGYQKIVKIACRDLPNGDTQEVPVTIVDGAVVDAVSMGRFLMPFSATDPQLSPWCGEEHSKSPYEIQNLENGGFFRPGTMDKLRQWVSVKNLNSTGVERQFLQSQEKLEERQAQWPNLIDWCEIWCSFNVDKNPNGRMMEVVIHYHRPSQTFMSIRYNWHDDLHRPYRVGNYFNVEHRWTGIGIAKQNEQFQKEVTIQHRQRIDNATLANMRMFKISKMSGYGPGEELFPGKMWFVDDMAHVDTIQMGDVYNSSFNDEQATLQYSQQRVGISDANLGMPAAGTPGTATGDLARIQEGAKKFDFAYSNIKDFVREVIVDTAVIIQQHGPHQIRYFDVADGGHLVEQFFQMPPEDIRHGLLLELAATSQQQNKILDRQSWLQNAQLLNQYYTGLLQLAQATGNQQLIAMIGQVAPIAATEAMKQILEAGDVRNVDRMILAQLLTLGSPGAPPNARLLSPGQPTPVGGGGSGPGNPDQTSGMDLLGQIIQAVRGGGLQGAGNIQGQ